MKYPLAIFDFDGTLANTLPHFLKILNTLAEEHHFRRIEPDDIPHLRNSDARQILRHIGLPLWKLPWVARQLLRRLSTEIEGIELFPGIEAGLQNLAATGIRLSIVSSNSWANIQRILGSERSKLFEFAECDASIFGKRPKLRRVLRRAGLSSDAAIYIGDEIRDMQAAQAEGIDFGGVTWGHTSRSMFVPCHPTALFESVDEMIHWLMAEQTTPTYSP